MNDFNLNAISPIDGRYASKTSELNDYFSEKALIKYRLIVEIEYFISLCEFNINELKDFDSNKFESIREIYLNFSSTDAAEIKEIEKTTNHDVKAVEYYLKNKFLALNLSDYSEFIHFGLTSQDINNTAIPLSFKEMLNQIYYDSLNDLINSIDKIQIGEVKSKCLSIIMEQDNLTVSIPIEKISEVGLRKLSSKKNMMNALNLLKGKARIRRMMWSRKAQEY